MDFRQAIDVKCESRTIRSVAPLCCTIGTTRWNRVSLYDVPKVDSHRAKPGPTSLPWPCTLPLLASGSQLIDRLAVIIPPPDFACSTWSREKILINKKLQLLLLYILALEFSMFNFTCNRSSTWSCAFESSVASFAEAPSFVSSGCNSSIFSFSHSPLWTNDSGTMW